MTVMQLFRATSPVIIVRFFIELVFCACSALILFGILASLGLGSGIPADASSILIAGVLWAATIAGLRMIMFRTVGYLVQSSHILAAVNTMEGGEPTDFWLGMRVLQGRMGGYGGYAALKRQCLDDIRAANENRNPNGSLDYLNSTVGVHWVGGLIKVFLRITGGLAFPCCLAWAFSVKREDMDLGAAVREGAKAYAADLRDNVRDEAILCMMRVGFWILVLIGAMLLYGLFSRHAEFSGPVSACLSVLGALLVKYTLGDPWLLLKRLRAFMMSGL